MGVQNFFTTLDQTSCSLWLILCISLFKQQSHIVPVSNTGFPPANWWVAAVTSAAPSYYKKEKKTLFLRFYIHKVSLAVITTLLFLYLFICLLAVQWKGDFGLWMFWKSREKQGCSTVLFFKGCSHWQPQFSRPVMAVIHFQWKRSIVQPTVWHRGRRIPVILLGELNFKHHDYIRKWKRGFSYTKRKAGEESCLLTTKWKRNLLASLIVLFCDKCYFPISPICNWAVLQLV